MRLYRKCSLTNGTIARNLATFTARAMLLWWRAQFPETLLGTIFPLSET